MRWRRLFQRPAPTLAKSEDEGLDRAGPTNVWRTCHVDIIDKCNLRCPTCVRGTRLLKNSGGEMSLDTFRSVVRKAKTEGYHGVGLFNWIEPFLCKTIDRFVAIVKEEGLYCGISSNLSLKPDIYFDHIQRALATGVGSLIVSVSGCSQEIYEVNHVGGKIAWVKENLEGLARLKREGSIGTQITLKFIRFDYNAGEEAALAAYARELAVSFEAITGVGDPARPVDRYCSEESFAGRLGAFRSSRANEKNGDLCPLITDMAIDSNGDSFLCCAYPYYPMFRIGPYLEMSKEELLLQRYTHPFCTLCDFPRRTATGEDRDRIVEALKARFGQ